MPPAYYQIDSPGDDSAFVPVDPAAVVAVFHVRQYGETVPDKQYVVIEADGQDDASARAKVFDVLGPSLGDGSLIDQVTDWVAAVLELPSDGPVGSYEARVLPYRAPLARMAGWKDYGRPDVRWTFPLSEPHELFGDALTFRVPFHGGGGDQFKVILGAD